MHIVRSELVDELLAAREGGGANAAPAVLLLRLEPSDAASESLLSVSDSHQLQEDADGDLELPRRKRPRSRRHGDGHSPDPNARVGDAPIEIETMVEGSADATGVQLWRASLLLAEYLQSRADHLQGSTVLELGCGVGVVAIAAARCARTVYATDGDVEALAVCARNMERNAWTHDRVRVRHLEWTGKDHLQLNENDSCDGVPGRFQFTESEDTEMAQRLDWIVASDVFYDDNVADIFLDALHQLMQRHPTATVVVAAERRTVFSAFTLSEISLGYDAFQRRQCPHQPTGALQMRGCVVSCHECSGSGEPRARFVATLIPIDSIPRLYDYDLVSTLAIWQLQGVRLS